jgi:hypothetical protein
VKKVLKERTKKKSESVAQPASAAVVAAPETPVPDSFAIHHEPYSYLIPGKRTNILAVLSSSETIQAAYCRFRVAENGPYARVPMQQVSGTHFTYVATLPALAASSRSLRYVISTVDASGKETLSQEFVIGVKASAVLPGWQFENTPEMIKIRLENKEIPLEGFSDRVLAE